eukprot:5185834-Amphidinium_carterae.1
MMNTPDSAAGCLRETSRYNMQGANKHESRQEGGACNSDGSWMGFAIPECAATEVFLSCLVFVLVVPFWRFFIQGGSFFPQPYSGYLALNCILSALAMWYPADVKRRRNPSRPLPTWHIILGD